jgi:hypothetical protein
MRYLHKGINDFKRSYQHRTNLVKDEKGDLAAETYNIVARWKNYFSHKYTQQNH